MSKKRENSLTAQTVIASLLTVLETRYAVTIKTEIKEKTADGRLFFYDARCEK